MVTFVCLGNEFRSDDAVGLYIGEQLKKHGFNVIFAHTNPEAVLSKIPKEDKIYFVDAAEFHDEKPFVIGKSAKSGISTHSYSFDLIEKFLDREVFVAGIKTYNHEVGEQISEKAKSNADDFIEYVLGISSKG